MTRCDSCGQGGAVLVSRPGSPEYLCGACESRAQLEERAAADLRAQLAPVLRAWAARWSADLTPASISAARDAALRAEADQLTA